MGKSQSQPGTASGADLAGRDYWESVWEGASFDPLELGDGNPAARRAKVDEIELFERIFRDLGAGSKLIEIGCASSPWLHYFESQFGFDVTGIDYAETACEKTRQALLSAGSSVKVVDADLFDLPAALRQTFDVAISFGVLEHFEDTRSAAEAMADLVRPGGLLVALVPNMAGLPGLLQRLVDHAVYAKHVVLTPGSMCAAFRRGGLELESSRYLGFANLWFVNVSRIERWKTYPVVWHLLDLANRLMVFAGDRLPGMAPNRFTSPQLYCCGSTPGEDPDKCAG